MDNRTKTFYIGSDPLNAGTKQLVCIFLVGFVLQGCGMPNQAYVRKDNQEPKPLKVARYETPSFRTYTTGGLVVALVVPGLLFGVIGVGLGYALHHAASLEPDDPTRPDFGQLVMEKFTERAKKEIPTWPDMIILGEPITEPLTDQSAYVLEIAVNDIRVETGTNTLIIDTIITMKGRGSNTDFLWQKGYSYDSSNYQR